MLHFDLVVFGQTSLVVFWFDMIDKKSITYDGAVALGTVLQHNNTLVKLFLAGKFSFMCLCLFLNVTLRDDLTRS